jgi:hypothetical protein
MIFAMIIGVARVDHFWSIVLAMVVLGTAVQFGYLAGIAIRAAVGSVILVPHAQAALTGHPGAGGKMIEVAKVRITAAGRDALAAEGW